MIYLVFGEMGIGKNFVGERLADKLKCYFVDGDQFLTAEMQAKVKAFKPLTKQDLDVFMRELVKGVAGMYKGSDLVVAQALYRQEHRDWIKNELSKQNISTTFVWIPVSSLLTHIKRLWSRSFKWVLYGMFNKLFFQKPTGSFLTIHNRDERHLDNQLCVIRSFKNWNGIGQPPK